LSANKPNKKELSVLMIAGCLLGILCFALVYGFKIVDVSYDGWIYYGDFDLMQHHNGFCHFRNTPWHFPFGLIDTLSVPYSMSVVYTDSIPLFAVIFKLFRNVLPVHFQYFGLFGLICYMMMGMLSPVLIRRFTDRKEVCIAGSLFFIVSFPVLHRMFYHTALSAQWIIVLALIVWFYNDITDKSQTKKLCIYWALIGLLSVSIHSYFVFMTGIVIAASIVEGIIKIAVKNKTLKTKSSDSYEYSNNIEKSESSYRKKRKISEYIYIVYPLICMGVASFALLYCLGGFYGSGSVSGDGFGSFNGNLSAYINPLEYGSVFKGFDLNGMFEFEGFAYVGAGILLILTVWVIYFIASFIKKMNRLNSSTEKNKEKSDKESADIKTEKDRRVFRCVWQSISLRKKIIFFTVIIVLLASCFPRYSFGSAKLIGFPVPAFLTKLLGICRTNARFVWVGMYLIIIATLTFIGRNYEKVWVKLLFAAAVILQLYDISGTVKNYHEKYSQEKTYESVWTDLDEKGVLDNKTEFVFMYRNSDQLMMDSAYYGYLNGMSQNCYYYARTIYDEIEANVAEWNDEFNSGIIRDDIVYIFAEEDYSDAIDKIVRDNNAEKNSIPGHVIITR